jgi:hypothetical protein
MLNRPDYCVTALEFPYESEDEWAVYVTFRNRKTGKMSTSLFNGRESYFSVQRQVLDQMKAREYVTCTYATKPKKKPAPAPAPIIGKGKGKGKKG